MPGNSFTKADIQKSLKYNPRENHPEFYGKGLPEGVEYLPLLSFILTDIKCSLKS